MTACRHIPGREVPICCRADETLETLDDGRFTLILIESGSARFLLGGVDCFVTGPAMLCLCDAAKLRIAHKHALRAAALSFAPSFLNVGLSWEVIHSADWPALREQHGYPDLRLFFPAGAYNGVLPLYGDLAERAGRTFARIEEQLDGQPDAFWSCRSRSWVFVLLRLMRAAYDSVYGDAQDDDLAARVCAYIAAHLEEPVTVDRLCRVFAVNRTTLAARFRERTGMTVHAWLTESRLQAVKYQLAFTELSAREIAEMNGFGKASYLTRVFRTETGMTPLEFRKRMRDARGGGHTLAPAEPGERTPDGMPAN